MRRKCSSACKPSLTPASTPGTIVSSSLILAAGQTRCYRVHSLVIRGGNPSVPPPSIHLVRVSGGTKCVSFIQRTYIVFLQVYLRLRNVNAVYGFFEATRGANQRTQIIDRTYNCGHKKNAKSRGRARVSWAETGRHKMYRTRRFKKTCVSSSLFFSYFLFFPCGEQ